MRNPRLEWVCVRPDTLVEGDVSCYAVHEALVSGLFKPDSSSMANVAHFLCELVVDPAPGGRGPGSCPWWSTPPGTADVAR